MFGLGDPDNWIADRALERFQGPDQFGVWMLVGEVCDAVDRGATIWDLEDDWLSNYDLGWDTRYYLAFVSVLAIELKCPPEQDSWGVLGWVNAAPTLPLPVGDIDGDGFDDAEEIVAGSDEFDPDDTP